jgi:tetratricopeptide (TPR) repeat protein
MSTEKTKSSVEKAGSASATVTTKPGAPQTTQPQSQAVIPPLFRRIDWITFGITALLIFIGYFLTLSPDLTLEDSGELATGSFYAGVPHPPGYPLWTIFTWCFTRILPFSNIAYRVSIASAFSGALACGLLALIVSRGSSMMIESIAEFKGINRRAENAICMISGFVAGTLLAFNGYMWSQSVIVEVYPFSVLSLMGVVALLLRWIYAPHQRRYLYWAWFLFGVCFTNHQTLIVAAMGIEVAILAAQPKLGRDLLLWNSVAYLAGCVVLFSHMMGAFEPNGMVLTIYHIVGVASIIGCAWLTLVTKKLATEIWPALAMLLLWLVGAGIYFYMPLASMSNPPMNWGYPRTLEGFIHALTRGQYEKTNPTNFFNDPQRFIMQLGMYFEGAKEEFNLVNLVLALVPFLFFLRMQKRERAWLIGLMAIWSCLAILLLILLNPAPDRATHDLIKVFFTASYTVIAIMIGYGLTFIGASMVTNYQSFRTWGLAGGLVAIGLALYTLADTTQSIFGEVPNMNGFQLFFYAIKKSFAANQYGLPIHAGLILLGLTLAYLAIHFISRAKPLLPATLVLFALLPMHSILSHWSDNEQRGHLFGYWFGHDMFTPPFKIYPEMTRDAVLFGGTDPGRFCPTYMIFCESQIPARCKPRDPVFDRRDVYIITQNALADGTYLEYIRAHYNRSTQKDPPFFQELLRPPSERDPSKNYKTNFVAKLAYQLLDKPFLKLGANIEARRRADGVYPKTEIYTPTPKDSEDCFRIYLDDASRRLDHDMRFPNEPKQIKLGEDVHLTGDRVQVSGQVAVMAINGLLTKVIFDHNPTNEFFVEESFPLDWMYPYLTPFGVIMKINREQVPEFTDDIIKKDHDFWSQYSSRLIGNWVTYDTSVKTITDFVEKVYKEHDFNGFTGDRKFVRDDQAQKAFSKLRSSIGGIYNWRIGASKTPAERVRMIKEADFAFRQAFAFCPYSPEAVFRYVQLLASPEIRRFDDAILVASTCLKLDPYNGQVKGLVDQLKAIKNQMGEMPAPATTPQAQAQAKAALQKMEKDVQDNPTNFQAAFTLASAYLQSQQSDKAIQTLDRVLANPKADAGAVMFLAQAYSQLGNYPKMESASERLVQLEPDSPEVWYNLAGIKSAFGKTNEAIKALTSALDTNAKRLARDPKATNLLLTARADPRFNPIRTSPQFQALVK